MNPNEISDVVTREGKSYRLADLAHYMEHEEREAVHFAHLPDESPRRAAHLVTIVPQVRGDE